MATPHRWQKEMHHFADGGSVQWRSMASMPWADLFVANFEIAGAEYRVKQEPIVRYAMFWVDNGAVLHGVISEVKACNDNIKFTITDGKITAVELIKAAT